MAHLRHKVSRARAIIKNEGVTELAIRVLKKTQSRRRRVSNQPKVKIKPHFLVKYEDVEKNQWPSAPYRPPKTRVQPPFTINWVMSTPGKSSGGHQNIYRFIKFLEDQGHTCLIYFYSSLPKLSKDEIEETLATGYEKVKAKSSWLSGPMEPADAVFATGWETAYPVYNDPGKARKLYFVQDFEPYFYPVSSEYILAENTYHFGFQAVTAGGWLANKLQSDYGMETAHYDFGADKKLYRFENKGKRKEIFFYARPVTARRGFELGIMALDLFHRAKPDYKITLAGWDVSDYHIPFPYTNLKSLSLNELSDVYNQCALSLVISLTNMSLMPLELLSCGTIPVLNKGPNNSQVSDNLFIVYAEPSPNGLAQAMIDVVNRKDLPGHAEAAAKSVANTNWQVAGDKFVAAVTRFLNG